MSANAICTSSETGFVCKHCTPEQMRDSARKLLDNLVRRGEAGKTLATFLIHGKCVEYSHAINVERYRRGWFEPTMLRLIGCPNYVYKELKDEEGLPLKTLEALHRYEELHPEALKTKIIEKTETVDSLGVFASGEKIWVSSRDVANKFEKNHRDVMRSIKMLDCSEDFRARNFALSSYSVETGNGTYKEYPEYLMTRDGFTFLAMGFTGAKSARFKEAYIAEFNRMEEELYRQRFALPNSVPKERERELLTVVQKESKKAVTAMTTALRARKRELALQRRLDAALDLIAELKEKNKG